LIIFVNSQQDAHEFLVDFLNSVNEEMEYKLKSMLLKVASDNKITIMTSSSSSSSATSAVVNDDNITSVKRKFNNNGDNNDDSAQDNQFILTNENAYKVPLTFNLYSLLPTLRFFHSSVKLDFICQNCGFKKEPKLVSSN
jgi:hypothetical protein